MTPLSSSTDPHPVSTISNLSTSIPDSGQIKAVETHHLTHQYAHLLAVNDLNMSVYQGDLFGFIGSNGAGKTTTLKILALFLCPTQGTASVCGYDIRTQEEEVRRRIGYMPDFFGVYKDMSVNEYLDFFGACYQIPAQKRNQIIRDTLHLVGLDEKIESLIGGLSRGMQQRLGLARVLIHNPELLLLDEPASGLDPRARVEMMQILLKLQKQGKTIIISSHILSELQTLCNRVAMIEKGKLLYCGPTHGIKFSQESTRDFLVTLGGDIDSALRALEKIPQFLKAEPLNSENTNPDLKKEYGASSLKITLSTAGADPSAIAECLIKNGIKLYSLTEKESSLEQFFLRLTRGETQ